MIDQLTQDKEALTTQVKKLEEAGAKLDVSASHEDEVNVKELQKQHKQEVKALDDKISKIEFERQELAEQVESLEKRVEEFKSKE